MNSDREMRDLKRHEIDRTFAGVVLHISELHKDLLAFQARMEQRFDRVLGRHRRVSGRFDKIDGKLDRIERGLRGLRADMPRIVRRAIREAVRANARKKP